MHRLTAVVLACCTALSVVACESGGGSNDELQVVQNPRAATPAKSPPPTAEPDGTVLRVRGGVTALGVEVDSRTLAVGVGASALMYDLDDLEGEPQRLRAPGEIERLEPARGKWFNAAIPSKGRIAFLARGDDVVGQGAHDGGPASVAYLDGKELVALRDRAAVAISANEHPGTTISGELASADQVLAAGKRAVVLDRVRSALFELDLEAGDVGLGLRAGQGATNAVVDRFDRVLVTDTRAGALLAFSVDPLLLRQRYPVPGGVYGIAYDAEWDLAWVTLTARNEVVGFDVAGGEPVEKHRFATVRQPNTVAVDARTGRVVVGSGTGDGLQVIEP